MERERLGTRHLPTLHWMPLTWMCLDREPRGPNLATGSFRCLVDSCWASSELFMWTRTQLEIGVWIWTGLVPVLGVQMWTGFASRSGVLMKARFTFCFGKGLFWDVQSSHL